MARDYPRFFVPVEGVFAALSPDGETGGLVLYSEPFLFNALACGDGYFDQATVEKCVRELVVDCFEFYSGLGDLGVIVRPEYVLDGSLAGFSTRAYKQDD